LRFLALPSFSASMFTTDMKSGAVRFSVYVQPRAAKTEIVGKHGDALKIRVAAPPVEGAANEELVRFLAKQLRVPLSAIRVVGGAHGRRKTMEIDGINAEAAAALLGGIA
jgi:uncharacterized protein